MDADVSTDPSDYSDDSNSDSEYESTLSTDDKTKLNDDDKSTYCSSSESLRSHHCSLPNPINHININHFNQYSIEGINKSIDAVLSLLSINNNNNNNNNIKDNNNNKTSIKMDDDSTDSDHTDNDSSYCYSSEPSYSDDQNDDYFPNNIDLDSLINNNNNNNNNKNKSKSSSKPKRKRNKKKQRFEGSVKCEICCDEFKYHTLYRKHMNKIHRIDKAYVCPQCPKHDKKRYVKKAGLDAHIERDHEGIKRFQCDLCPKAFYEKASLKYHERAHQNNKLFEPISCQHCNDTFTSHPKYRKHMNEIHKIQRAYICIKCPNDSNRKRYANKAGLEKHIKRDHEMERRFKCKLCPKEFYEKSVLLQHQRVHDGLKPFSCPHCKLKFTAKCSKRQHIIAVHLKQKNYECRYCGKRFASSTTMKSHVTSIHGDEKYARFQCTTCNKRFYDKSSYHTHRDVAHRPKDPKKEMIKKGECFYPECNKKYTAKNKAECVKYHLVAAHKDREYAKYECKKCKKLFYDKTRHNQHIRRHKKKKKK